MLNPDTLWALVKERTVHALHCGALQPVPTTWEFLEQNGVRFLVRMMTNLVRKDEAKKQQDRATAAGKAFNPFLPYDDNLFVTNFTDTHLGLLNKFNVVDYHLLIVTRAFEEQERLLTLQDFEAMWLALAGIDSLVFYNGGKLAGSSQPHKHLQLVPLPITPEGAAIPMESLFAFIQWQDGIGTIPKLPFVHAIAPVDPAWMGSPTTAAQATLHHYHTLLKTVGLWNDRSEQENWQAGPYNLLITRQWMVLVPRSQEDCEGIPVNSLGFAGTLMVRNAAQMQRLKELGPMTILSQVSLSWYPS